MLSHTVNVGDRDPKRLPISPGEACEMYAKGFRFSVFRPGREECRLSIPYAIARDLDRGTVTFMQDEQA